MKSVLRENEATMEKTIKFSGSYDFQCYGLLSPGCRYSTIVFRCSRLELFQFIYVENTLSLEDLKNWNFYPFGVETIFIDNVSSHSYFYCRAQYARNSNQQRRSNFFRSELSSSIDSDPMIDAAHDTRTKNDAIERHE